jgi:hypothetical protein
MSKTLQEAWTQLRWQFIIGLFLSSLFGWIAFMAADNTSPYEYDAENSHIIPAKAADGDQITVMWKLKKINRFCPGSNNRVLFDPASKVILASYDATPTAIPSSIKHGYLNRTFQLPRSTLPPGRIGYRGNICYECNLFQKLVKPLCITTPELFFEVIP